MKKLFEPIKLRDNSRERVLRELISYNDNKGKNEEAAKSFSKNFSENKPQHELKPHKRKKASVVMEVLAGAAVIAMLAGIISISINKSAGIKHQPAKSTGSQNVTEKISGSNSGQNNSPQGAIPVDTPMIEFISSKNLGMSIAFNKQYFKEYTEDDNGIILYQNDAGTDTGFNWNNIQISASVNPYEEEVYNWSNDVYDHYYGALQSISDVTIGNLSSDYLSGLGIVSDASSTGIPATKLSFSYELSDNTSECMDVYVIDSRAYYDSLNSEVNDTYGAYIIKAAYQIFHNDNTTEYSTEPELIYNTIDSFSLTQFTKKTYYILASDTKIYITYDDGIRIPEYAFFSKNYSSNAVNNQSDNATGYNSYYSFFSSTAVDEINDNFKVTLPVGHLYDAAGVRDIFTNDDFYPTFRNMVAIDLYYPDYYNYNESSYDNSNIDITYPSYGVLHSVFQTDDNNDIASDITEKSTVSPTDNVSVSKSFEVFPNGDRLISIDDKYCTIYGISEDFKKQKSAGIQTTADNGISGTVNADNNNASDVSFNYDYVIYVPIENIYDVNGNLIGDIIADINEITPSLTMTVYYDGRELETFPAQIYANEVVIYGLETTGIYN